MVAMLARGEVEALAASRRDEAAQPALAPDEAAAEDARVDVGARAAALHACAERFLVETSEVGRVFVSLLATGDTPGQGARSIGDSSGATSHRRPDLSHRIALADSPLPRPFCSSRRRVRGHVRHVGRRGVARAHRVRGGGRRARGAPELRCTFDRYAQLLSSEMILM